MKHAQTAAAAALFLMFVAMNLPAGSAGPKDKNVEKAMRSIRPAEGYEFVKTLASPEFNGRQSGGAGATASCSWAAARFREWGLRTLSGKGWLLPFLSPGNRSIESIPTSSRTRPGWPFSRSMPGPTAEGRK